MHRDLRHGNSLTRLRTLVRARLKRQATDLAHDFSHVMRVWKNAQFIANTEMAAGRLTADGDVVESAVYLHEMGRGAEMRGETRGEATVRMAEEMLRNCSLDHLVFPVCETIVSHISGTDRRPVTAEARILRDADWLDDLGAVGVARALLGAGASMAPTLYDADDVRAVGRQLDPQAYLIDDFPSRLFPLVERMETEAGKLEGKRRLQMVRAFYNAFLSEVSG